MKLSAILLEWEMESESIQGRLHYSCQDPLRAATVKNDIPEALIENFTTINIHHHTG